MSKIILIDGDSILYRVAFRGEELCEIDSLESDEDDGMSDMVNEASTDYAYSGDYSLHLPSSFSAIEYSIEKMVDAWRVDMIADTGRSDLEGIEIYMTGKPGRLHCEELLPNFRNSYVDDYKENRKDSRPPAGLKELWAHIFSLTEIDGLPVTVRVADNSEADDIVVYLKTQHPEKYAMCALDKDVLYQSAGYHYNYGKDEFVTVTELDAVKYLYFQMIAGDPSDGYKGVPGVGKVGADKALKGLVDPTDMWEATLALYKKKGLGLGEAIQTGILASMHQVTSVRMEGLVAYPTLNLFKALK